MIRWCEKCVHTELRSQGKKKGKLLLEIGLQAEYEVLFVQCACNVTGNRGAQGQNGQYWNGKKV